jgi:hypothetical protein
MRCRAATGFGIDPATGCIDAFSSRHFSPPLSPKAGRSEPAPMTPSPIAWNNGVKAYEHWARFCQALALARSDDSHDAMKAMRDA